MKHTDRIRSLRAQRTNKKRGRSSEEIRDDMNSTSISLGVTDATKPTEPLKKDELVVVKTYPFVDLVSETDADDESVSSDVQPPPRKKVKFVQASEVPTSSTPVAKFQGTKEDLNFMDTKLEGMQDNKMRPASVRLHLPDAPIIHEHEAIIDSIVRPYFAVPRSEEQTGWRTYGENRDKFEEAVEKLARLWAQYFGLGDPGQTICTTSLLSRYIFSMYEATKDNPQYDDWYGYWAIGQRLLLSRVKHNNLSLTKD